MNRVLTVAIGLAAVAGVDRVRAASTQPARRAAATRPAVADRDMAEKVRKLREALGMKSDENPLAGAARRMGKASARLRKADSGLGTQEVQNQIVRDLDAVIAMMEKNSSKGGQSGKKKQSQKKKRSQPKRKPSASGGTGKQAMKDSKPTTGRAAAAVTGAMPRDAEKWGFLPEALREEILQSFKEDFLPRFRALLEEYYAALSRRGQSTQGEERP